MSAPTDDTAPLFRRLCAWLDGQGAVYRTVRHEPTYTSEESARARGEDVAVGGKAIVLKTDETFRIVVLSAACKVDSKKVKELFGVKNVRFATSEELLALTGLVPGSVPPFGRPVLDLELTVDASVFRNDRIAFNAGSLTDSVIMSIGEYRRVTGAVPADLSRT